MRSDLRDSHATSLRRAQFVRLAPALWLMALAGCGKPSYSPLDAQLSWRYAVTVEPRDRSGAVTWTRRGESTMRNLAARDLGGRKVTPQSVEVGGQFATIFRAEDKDGLRVVATQTSDDKEPQLKDGQFDLRYPLLVGRTWDDTSETMFLKERVELDGDSKIEALDDTITVPAGTYRGCVRVRFTSRTYSELPARLGFGPVTIESVRWFAPNVGMVKYRHDERSGAGSGTFTAELQSFKLL
jgi:hypothetical protein